MESWIALFVVVTTIALVVQAIILITLFLQVRRTAARVEQVIAELNVRLNPILSRVQTLVEDVSPRISGLVADVSEFTRLARAQAQKVDRVFTETTERLRLQLIHVDQILSGVLAAVEETGSSLKQTIWGPVIKASALIRGIQTGLEFYRTARQGREHVEPPSEHQDQGMFI
jgi:hypothetical protein